MQVKKALGVAVVVACVGSGGIYFAQNSATGEPIPAEPVEEVTSPPVAPTLSGSILPEHEHTSTAIE